MIAVREAKRLEHQCQHAGSCGTCVRGIIQPVLERVGGRQAIGQDLEVVPSRIQSEVLGLSSSDISINAPPVRASLLFRLVQSLNESVQGSGRGNGSHGDSALVTQEIHTPERIHVLCVAGIGVQKSLPPLDEEEVCRCHACVCVDFRSTADLEEDRSRTDNDDRTRHELLQGGKMSRWTRELRGYV
ncbi:MAG: hypothetical protein P8J32_06000 [bacterium]|nr:hypothetical protein [bacterium]